MLADIGLIAGVALLIWLALKGVNILLAVLISAVVIGVTNAMPLADVLLKYFPTGPS